MSKPSKFFNNVDVKLFDKLAKIVERMPDIYQFLAVAGYFRSSGYFKLRAKLEKVKKIKILVGINVDELFRRYNHALHFLPNSNKVKDIYSKDFCEDVETSFYDTNVERGMLQMRDDILSERLEIRIHPSKNLHAKFYLCLPRDYDDSSSGWVIMGSSNISESGLGISRSERYELNVAMQDYDDVSYCANEFETLWNESQALTPSDVQECYEKTYLGYQPTPYEIYMKVLIDTFGNQVEDDFSLQLPTGVKDLRYQKDAVIQGYQMLMRHNGVFLADVVGLGKTMIATMIAKRFIEANGKHTNVLVIYPPALENNWKETFKLFDIYKKTQFITNGSLSKILTGRDQYKDKGEFDLIIVDESHGFRNDSSGKYDELQKICKSSCSNGGLLHSSHKKVMLLSATPLNNRPEDIKNQLLLFQDAHGCTIDGVPDIESFFEPHIQAYNKLMKERENRDVTSEVDQIYEIIRTSIIDKVTVRRTRSNILNDPNYNQDIQSQGIVFPQILPPFEIEYNMDDDTSALFYITLESLTNETYIHHLNYARYRAVEFLKPEYRNKYPNALSIGETLKGIYRVHMVKRLESSFHAFRKSLQMLLSITKGMIKMFEENVVIIAPELNVRKLQSLEMELDDIMEYAIKKGYIKEEIQFTADQFESRFIEMLHHDRDVLELLVGYWEQVEEDPKYDEFERQLNDVGFFNPQSNLSGKLVVFSESVDTLNYLEKRLIDEKLRSDVLLVTAKNRKNSEQVIKENFDANYEGDAHRYNIILTSDVLAEGVNLHRSNVIVNYDSPWNATRLMQRIGRVNRIGSKAPHIYNYVFYPSKQGNNEIQLYKNALIKLQGFHSAFGEDAQIFSKEEIVGQFSMFDPTVKDSVDKRIALLREVSNLYNENRNLYHKIKNLPMKSRVMRNSDSSKGKTVVFISSRVKTEFYLASNECVETIDFLQAADYLKAAPDEPAAPFNSDDNHFGHVQNALDKYKTDYIVEGDTDSVQSLDIDQSSKEARKFLRTIKQIFGPTNIQRACNELISYIDMGTYKNLPRRLKKISRAYKNDRIRMKIDECKICDELMSLLDEYSTSNRDQLKDVTEISDPKIIISETFI